VVEGSSPDYDYELGSRSIVPELDDRLQGARLGDILTFETDIPDGTKAQFRVLVKDIREKLLPEVTDEWAGEASEFDTVGALRDDITKRIGMVKRVQATLALRDGALQALTELVSDEVPEALVNAEVERRAHDLSHRLEAQRVTIPQYLEATGMSEEQLVADLRAGAVESVKADLALRAVAEAEELDVSDDDVEAEVVRMAERMGEKPASLRKALERAEQLPAVRSDLRKTKALEWLVEHVEVVDEEGRPVDRAGLGPPQLDQLDDEHDHQHHEHHEHPETEEA
jgi:trigger factor